MIIRKPDSIFINGEYTAENTKVETELIKDGLEVYLTSSGKIKFVQLHWSLKDDEIRREKIRILGDDFERGYGKLSWQGLNYERFMPWYFAVSNGSDSVTDYSGRYTECFGVEVRPRAFCSWYYDGRGVDLILDVRNGGIPVELGGRKLKAATVFFREYRNVSAFSALKSFCAVMSRNPLKTDKIIYGSNNWYYAYGKSSAEEIISDTKLVADLCKGCKNKPFMVIDDGWTPHRTTAPWISNEKFGDMKALAEKMKAIGVIPGIWVRFLYDEEFELDLPEEARRNGRRECLDPTHPAVKAFIAETIDNIVSWGYKLIKHDFSSNDISLGVWGKDVGNYCFCSKEEGFYDKSKTTAEIVVEFYELILEHAKDTLLIGCNTFSHLCAGLVHANRTGDDTSGREWIQTRKMGVNSLAFRLCQNGSFYVADADCVGILGDNIDWKLNKQWLELVSKSGSALFVSCQPSKAEGKIAEDLMKNFAIASEQKDEMIPLDWMENAAPERYLINGEERFFNWSIDKRI